MKTEPTREPTVTRTVVRWFWVVFLSLAAYFITDFAGRKAEKVEKDLGSHADYNEIVHETSFLAMVLALTLVSLSLCLIWMTLTPVSSLRWRLALACASVAGSIPELYFPMAAYSYRMDWLSPEFPLWRLNQVAEIFDAPGRLIAYSLFGVSFCRWCEGLVDAPTVCGLYDVAAIQASNSAAYVLATAVVWKIAHRYSGGHI